MAEGTHAYQDDLRNQNIFVSVNGDLVPRRLAAVSVFDSGFILGDGVWEGLRLHNGHLAFWERHAARLFEGLKALDMTLPLTKNELHEEIMRTVDANGMASGVHLRVMVSRGIKATPYQDPRVTIGGPTIVIIPEYKEPLPETLETGISLFTVHVRRGRPDVLDPKINSHSKLNCVTACKPTKP